MARQRNKPKYTLATPESPADQLDRWKAEALPPDKQRLGLKIVLMTYDGIISEDQANRLLADLTR